MKNAKPKNANRNRKSLHVAETNQIVASLMRQLSWTHFLGLLPIDDPLKREFYIAALRDEEGLSIILLSLRGVSEFGRGEVRDAA